MELKLECLDASVRFKVLLIVPYGIEMNALFYLIQDL